MESWHKAHAQLVALTTWSGMAKSSPVPPDLLTGQYRQHTAHMQIGLLHWITPGKKKKRRSTTDPCEAKSVLVISILPVLSMFML